MLSQTLANEPLESEKEKVENNLPPKNLSLKLIAVNHAGTYVKLP